MVKIFVIIITTNILSKEKVLIYLQRQEQSKSFLFSLILIMLKNTDLESYMRFCHTDFHQKVKVITENLNKDGTLIGEFSKKKFKAWILKIGFGSVIPIISCDEFDDPIIIYFFLAMENKKMPCTNLKWGSCI